jgi:cobalt/nickel transport system permease protein
MLAETINGDTPIHRLEPRVRVLAALGFALACAFLWHPFTSALALLAAITLCAMAEIPWTVLQRRLVPLNVMLLFAAGGLMAGTAGAPLFALGQWGISDAGAMRALALLLKANALLLAVTALLGTLEATAFAHALERLGMPERLTRLLLFTVRYFEVFRRELSRLRLALRARGFRARLNLHTLRTYGYLVGMLIVHAFERAERVLQAMRCRGFTGRFPTSAATSLRGTDWIFATGVTLLLGGLLAGEHW